MVTNMKTMLRLLAFGFGIWSVGANAQTVEEFPLRSPQVSKEPPQAEQVLYRNNAYDERGFNRVIPQVAVPTLTVYRPARDEHHGAAFVICPGGGYEYVVIDREGHMLARYFQAQGFTVAVLKYRLPSPATQAAGLPAPQQDGLAAIQWLRSHAKEWALDPHRIGILGCSAGGHLAGSTAAFGTVAAGSRPDFVALLYPVVTLEQPLTHAGTRHRLIGDRPAAARVAEFSLEQRVQADWPPFFLVHAKNDKGVPPANSQMLAAALQRQHVPVDLLLVARGGHGFALGRDAESGRWKDAFVRWVAGLP